jgi:thiol-disulfide isomerase/thioredoxin
VQSVVRGFGGRVLLSVENYGDSALAKRFGVTRYPAVFVDDILVAKPKDFGFYGKGEGSGDGRYTPWREPASHEKFRADLTRIVERVLAGGAAELRAEVEAHPGPAAAGAETALRLPEFTAPDLAGRAIRGEDLAAKVVLVEFWATWCPPCRSTLASLGELKRRLGDRVEVVAVAIESDEADVRKVASEYAAPIRWTLGSPELGRAFGDITAVPSLFLFDPSGQLAESFFGAPPWLHDAVEKAVTGLVEKWGQEKWGQAPFS